MANHELTLQRVMQARDWEPLLGKVTYMLIQIINFAHHQKNSEKEGRREISATTRFCAETNSDLLPFDAF